MVPLGRMIFGRRDMLGELARLSLPRLVMTGSNDLPRPVHEGRQMAEALGCRFVPLPEAGHISSLEAPAAVNLHLLQFLGEHLPGSTGRVGPRMAASASSQGG